jgi:hypothetical protein
LRKFHLRYNGFFDSSFLNACKNIPAEAGIATYQAALEQANEQTRKLHSELSKADGGGEVDARLWDFLRTSV